MLGTVNSFGSGSYLIQVLEMSFTDVLSVHALKIQTAYQIVFINNNYNKTFSRRNSSFATRFIW